MSKRIKSIWDLAREAVPAWAYDENRVAAVQRLVHDAILAERQRCAAVAAKYEEKPRWIGQEIESGEAP